MPDATPDLDDINKRYAQSADSAETIAQERIAEWDYDADPHGYCHVRPTYVALLDALAAAREVAKSNQRVTRSYADELEKVTAARDAAYAALKAIDEHVTGMESEIGDHQDHDYNRRDHDETYQAGHTAGRDAEHDRIVYDLRELLNVDAVRLATGETCQPGQPWSCGDAHTAGHCVRPQADTTAKRSPDTIKEN